MPDTYSSLFWGYTVVWGILALYVWSLGARITKLERKAESLEGRVDGGEINSSH